MVRNDELVKAIKVTDKELNLVLSVRRKFKGCDCCVKMLIDLVEKLEKNLWRTI